VVLKLHGVVIDVAILGQRSPTDCHGYSENSACSTNPLVHSSIVLAGVADLLDDPRSVYGLVQRLCAELNRHRQLAFTGQPFGRCPSTFPEKLNAGFPSTGEVLEVGFAINWVPASRRQPRERHLELSLRTS
jgi:hypothetical protein